MKSVFLALILGVSAGSATGTSHFHAALAGWEREAEALAVRPHLPPRLRTIFGEDCLKVWKKYGEGEILQAAKELLASADAHLSYRGADPLPSIIKLSNADEHLAKHFADFVHEPVILPYEVDQAAKQHLQHTGEISSSPFPVARHKAEHSTKPGSKIWTTLNEPPYKKLRRLMENSTRYNDLEMLFPYFPLVYRMMLHCHTLKTDRRRSLTNIRLELEFIISEFDRLLKDQTGSTMADFRNGLVSMDIFNQFGEAYKFPVLWVKLYVVNEVYNRNLRRMKMFYQRIFDNLKSVLAGTGAKGILHMLAAGQAAKTEDMINKKPVDDKMSIEKMDKGELLLENSNNVVNAVSKQFAQHKKGVEIMWNAMDAPMCRHWLERSEFSTFTERIKTEKEGEFLKLIFAQSPVSLQFIVHNDSMALMKNHMTDYQYDNMLHKFAIQVKEHLIETFGANFADLVKTPEGSAKIKEAMKKVNFSNLTIPSDVLAVILILGQRLFQKRFASMCARIAGATTATAFSIEQSAHACDSHGGNDFHELFTNVEGLLSQLFKEQTGEIQGDSTTEVAAAAAVANAHDNPKEIVHNLEKHLPSILQSVEQQINVEQ